MNSRLMSRGDVVDRSATSTGELSRFAVSGATRAGALVGVMRKVSSCLQTAVLRFSIAQCAIQRLIHARRVAAHLQADENFDVAGIAGGFGGGNTALTQGW